VRRAVVWPQGCGAGPQLVIEEGWHRFERRVAVRAHVKVAAHIDVTDLAEQAGIDDLLPGVDQVRGAFALGPDLDHALVLARGIQHGLALAHIAADGFWQ